MNELRVDLTPSWYIFIILYNRMCKKNEWKHFVEFMNHVDKSGTIVRIYTMNIVLFSSL